MTTAYKHRLCSSLRTLMIQNASGVQSDRMNASVLDVIVEGLRSHMGSSMRDQDPTDGFANSSIKP